MSDSSAAAATTLSRALVEEMSGAAGEPAWLRDRRLAAWEAFVRLPLPSADDEAWRRTDISALDLDAFGVLPHSVQKGRAPAPLAALVGDPAGAAGLRLVVNGAQIEERLARDLAQRGLIFTSLSQAVAAHPDLVRPYLGTVVRDDENKFRAHHGALWSGGTFLYVPKGLEVDLQLPRALRALAREGSGRGGLRAGASRAFRLRLHCLRWGGRRFLRPSSMSRGSMRRSSRCWPVMRASGSGCGRITGWMNTWRRRGGRIRCAGR